MGEKLRDVLALDADERNRTSTGLPPHGPEPCASTNSATSAWCLVADQCSAQPGGTYDSLPRKPAGYHRADRSPPPRAPPPRAARDSAASACAAVRGIGRRRRAWRSSSSSLHRRAARNGGVMPTPRAARRRAALAAVERAQSTVSHRILSRIPGAEIRWRYRHRARRARGARARRRSSAGSRRSRGRPASIRASATRVLQDPARRSARPVHGHRRSGPVGAGARTRGRGMKIGIIDDGIDPTHPFFDPDGLHHARRVSEGRRRVHEREGDRRAGLSAARTPAGATRRGPFDPVHSFHGTHVAGIAAGGTGPVGAGDAGAS